MMSLGAKLEHFYIWTAEISQFKDSISRDFSVECHGMFTEAAIFCGFQNQKGKIEINRTELHVGHKVSYFNVSLCIFHSCIHIFTIAIAFGFPITIGYKL